MSGIMPRGMEMIRHFWDVPRNLVSPHDSAA